ncbi:DUF1772 domain-containing protein [Gryllotalpicola daejeonensis]
MLTALAVATATVVGLMVGVEFAVAFVLNPILFRLPVGPSLDAQADGARVLGRAMPVWYIASLVLTVTLAVFTWGSASARASVIAAVLFVISVVLSLALLVPINSRAQRWSADDHPADWREQAQRWNRLHYLRVVLIVVGFVFVLVAVAGS